MEKYKFSFEKLLVWQKAKDLVKETYIITRSFPDNEKFGLISQIRRAAVSIPSNIAEGSARKTKKDQAYFYMVAYSSLVELLNQVIISQEIGFLEEEKYQSLRSKIEEVSFLINKLRSALS